MNQSKLGHLVSLLSSEYDSDLPLIRGSSGHRRKMMEMTSSLITPSIHLIHEPCYPCSLPCLSLLHGNHNNYSNYQQRPGSGFEFSYALDEDVNREHLYFQQLLSRNQRFIKTEHASTAVLRNVVSSFGQILDFELQRRLYNIGERLDRVQESGKLLQMKDDILEKFERLSLLEGRRKAQSPAVPVYARTHFYTIANSSTDADTVADTNTVADADADADTPTSSHTRGSSTTDRDGQQQSQPSGHLDDDLIEIFFEAEICLHIPSDNTWVESHLRTKGQARLGGIRHPHKRYDPNELSVSLDMNKLYENIRKEARYVSKQIVKALVGKDIFRPRSKSRRRNHGPAGHLPDLPSISGTNGNGKSRHHRKQLSDGETTQQTTIDFIDDGSSMTTTPDSPIKYGILRSGGSGGSSSGGGGSGRNVTMSVAQDDGDEDDDLRNLSTRTPVTGNIKQHHHQNHHQTSSSSSKASRFSRNSSQHSQHSHQNQYQYPPTNINSQHISFQMDQAQPHRASASSKSFKKKKSGKWRKLLKTPKGR